MAGRRTVMVDHGGGRRKAGRRGGASMAVGGWRLAEPGVATPVAVGGRRVDASASAEVGRRCTHIQW